MSVPLQPISENLAGTSGIEFEHEKRESEILQIDRALYAEGMELMKLIIEYERENDGRWIAEIVKLPGVLAYGDTLEKALAKVQALAFRVVAERLEHGEGPSDPISISFEAA